MQELQSGNKDTDMTFKEQIAADTKNVFMNALEFSEEHIIDGRNMLCIVDNNELMARKVKYKFRSKFYVDQVGIKDILIYVRAEDFGALPAIGRTLIFDGKPYIICDAVNESGIYSINLEMNKA